MSGYPKRSLPHRSYSAVKRTGERTRTGGLSLGLSIGQAVLLIFMSSGRRIRLYSQGAYSDNTLRLTWPHAADATAVDEIILPLRQPEEPFAGVVMTYLGDHVVNFQADRKQVKILRGEAERVD